MYIVAHVHATMIHTLLTLFYDAIEIEIVLIFMLNILIYEKGACNKKGIQYQE